MNLRMQLVNGNYLKYLTACGVGLCLLIVGCSSSPVSPAVSLNYTPVVIDQEQAKKAYKDVLVEYLNQSTPREWMEEINFSRFVGARSAMAGNAVVLLWGREGEYGVISTMVREGASAEVISVSPDYSNRGVGNYALLLPGVTICIGRSIQSVPEISDSTISYEIGPEVFSLPSGASFCLDRGMTGRHTRSLAAGNINTSRASFLSGNNLNQLQQLADVMTSAFPNFRD